jgi:hypothetical protein
MLYSLAAIITGEISSKSEIKTQKFNEKMKSFLKISINPQESVLRKIN